MPLFSCPSCRQTIEMPFALAGSTGRCEHCGQAFRVPGTMIHEVEPPPVPAQPQIIVVSHSSSARTQPRLKSSGWFARAFMTTGGILAAFLAFNLFLLLALGTVAAIVSVIAENERTKAQPSKVLPRKR